MPVNRFSMCASKQPINIIKSLKSKMRTTPYHHNLISDEHRIVAFYEAIKEKARGTIYDIGSGCGILSILASFYCDTVYSVEIDPKAVQLAEYNFKDFNNILLIKDDAKNVFFPENADLIICEMLDTALIDEEQVTVINSILKYLNKDGDIIPYAILNAAELVSMDRNHICYEDLYTAPNYCILSNNIIYNKINFKKKIKEDVNTNIEFKICKKGTISAIKITTFTLLTENIICGPTPMLNPPLFIPIENMNVDIGDIIKVNLSYKMGGGLNSIKAGVKGIS